MNKFELINEIARTTKFTKKEINLILTAIIETIISTVAKKEKVTLVGFGSFKIRSIKSRYGINPRTKRKIFIPESNRPFFSVGKIFKNTVNNP